MPAYSFKKYLVPKVEDGSKPHTIRGKRRHSPRAGQTAYLYYGLRTKQVRHLYSSPITKVQDIRILTMDIVVKNQPQRHITVLVNTQTLDQKQIDSLAKKDGFDTTRQFIDFFHKQGKPMNTAADIREFVGDLIHWNPKVRLKG